MRLIFIRHGEPDYEHDSLTEKGWREAKLLAARTKDWHVDDFYVSPLGRARDTASFTLKAHGKTAEIMDWLHEFLGKVPDGAGRNAPLLGSDARRLDGAAGAAAAHRLGGRAALTGYERQGRIRPRDRRTGRAARVIRLHPARRILYLPRDL